MAQDNSKVGDILQFLKTSNPGVNTSDPTINFLRQGQTSTATKVNPKAAKDFNALRLKLDTNAANNELATRINEGDTNLFGATLRIITGLGRGIVNGAYDTMEQANNAWEAGSKGDFGGTFGSIIAAPFAFVGGAIRGVAGSAPGTEGPIQQLTGRPVIENWYELLKSPEFAQSAKNIPILKPLSSDQEIFGKGTWVTPSGIASTILDVGLDPASYATLGLGGALRGAGSAISKVGKVKELAKDLAKTGEEVPKGQYVIQNVYNKDLPPAKLADAADIMNGGRLSSSRFILRSAQSGFLDAHKRAIARIETKRLLKGPQAALYSAAENAADSELSVVLDRVAEQAAINLRKAAKEGKKAKSAEEELAAARENLAEVYRQYPNPEQVAERQAAISELRNAAEQIPTPKPALASKAIEKKLAAERALTGTKKTSLLVARREKKWLENPEPVANWARSLESLVLKGEQTSFTFEDLVKEFGPTDAKAIRGLVEKPFGYRERGAKGKADGAEPVSDVAVTASGRKITNADVRMVEQAIKGTKRARTVAEIQQSKELMRVLSLLSGLSKKVNKPGSKTTAGKSLVSAREIEAAFFTPHTLQNVPTSVLWARAAFLVERAQNTTTKTYENIVKYGEKGYNPLTEIGEHPLPTSFPMLGKRTAENPVFLSEIITAIKVVSGANYSPELIKILDDAGYSIVKKVEEGHPTLRTPDEIQEVLHAAMLGKAVRQAQREYDILFKELQKKYPGLTKDAIQTKLTPEDFAALEAVSSRSPELDMKTIQRLIAELNPPAEEIAKAKKLLKDNGIELDGRGAAFKTIAEGVIGARQFSGKATGELGALRKIAKTQVYKGGKSKPEISATEAFGDMANKFKTLATTAQSDAVRVAAAEAATHLETKALAIQEPLTPQDVNVILSQLENIIVKAEQAAVNGENAFLKLFVTGGGEFQKEWLLDFGLAAYKASIKAGSKDGGIFAKIVDDKIIQSFRKAKGSLRDVKRTSPEHLANVRNMMASWGGTGRVWDGEGITLPTLMELVAATSKSNSKVMEPVRRAALIKAIPEMVAKSQERVINFALGEERFAFPEEFDMRKFMMELLTQKKQTQVLDIDRAELTRLETEAAKFTYSIGGGVADSLLRLQKIRGAMAAIPESVRTFKGKEWPEALRAKFVAAGDPANLAKYIKNEADLKEAARHIQNIATAFRGQFARKAKAVIENIRMGDKVRKSWPEDATVKALTDSIKKTGSAAASHVAARLFMAETVSAADFTVRATDKVAARTRGTGVDITAERKRFAKQLDDYEKIASQKTGLPKMDPNSEEILKATIDDFGKDGKYENNPLALIAKIRNFEVTSSQAVQEDWKAYTKLLLESKIPTGEYRSLQEINAAALLEPVNRDALRSLAVALAEAGDKDLLTKLDRNVKPPRPATIEKNLDKLKQGLSLSPAELEEMIAQKSLATELNMVAPEEVEQLAADLMPDLELSDNLTQVLETGIRFYRNTGQDHIIDIAEKYAGAVINRHVSFRAENAREFESELGNWMDTNLPEGQFGIKDKNTQFIALRTLEPQATYTGSKVAYEALSLRAEAMGLAKDSVERMVFMRQNFEHIENMAHLQLKRLGLEFAFTLKAGTGEAGALRLYGKEDLEELRKVRPAAWETVYLSTADIKQMLPDSLTERLFYAGRENSLPETSISGAVRLAVALRAQMDNGLAFTNDIQAGLETVMFDMIRAEIKSNTSMFENGIKGSNWYSRNQEMADQKISEFVVAVLQRDVLDRLVQAHIENGAFALKMSRKQVHNVLGKKIMKLAKTIKNPAFGAGDRIQTAIAIFREFETLYKDTRYSEAFRNTARFDLNTWISANLTKDDLNTLVTALYKEEQLAEELTGEAALIAAVPRKGKKDIGKVAQAARKMEADHFNQAYDNALAGNLIKAAEDGTISEEMVAEAYANHAATTGQALFTKKYYGGSLAERASGLGERLFYAWGQDNIAPISGAIKRISQEQVVTKSAHLEALAKRLDSIGVPAARRVAAYNILKLMPEDLLKEAGNSHVNLQKALLGEKISLEDAKIANTVLDDLRPIFAEAGQNIEDQGMLEAVTSMSQHVNEIFGGGLHSLVASAGINPQYLNQAIAEIGGKQIGVQFKTTKLETITNEWREWDAKVDPLEMIRVLHAGLKHAEQLPMAAITITKEIGIPRTAFANAEEAAANGFGILDEVSEPTSDLGLIYFIDTENHYFPLPLIPEIKQAAKMIAQDVRMVGNGMLEKTLRKFDYPQNLAKQLMTTLRPGNWAQNVIGGLTVNAFKGVNPIRYSQAISMINKHLINARDLKAAGWDITEVEKMGARHIRAMQDSGYAIKPSAEGKVSVLVGRRRVDYDEADIMELYKRQGGLVSTSAVFDPIDTQLRVRDFLKSGAFKRFTTGVGRVAATRDDGLRLALYLDLMKKQGGKSLEDASRQALREVNRVHPQMQDLSVFNQKYMKRLVMFFTWRAKTMAFLITEILDQPGAILAFQKAYTNTMLSQGLDVQIGDLEPKNVPMRSYQEGNMNVMLPGFGTQENLYSFSMSNPVNDLFGSSGWLSNISLNTYEPIQNQIAMKWGLGTMSNLFASSEPMAIGVLADWVFAKQTNQGSKFAQSPDAVPMIIEDAFSRMGLKPIHTALAYFAPDVFTRISWQGKTMNDVDKEAQLEWFNWLTGLKLKQVDKPEDVKKAIQEQLRILQQYQQRERLQQQKNLGG